VSSETVTISREEYEEYELLKLQNERLTQQIEFLTEQIRLARRQRFGSSSEQSRYDDGSEQLSFLFNEAETYAGSAPAITAEPDLSQVKAHTRKKRITSEEKLPENIEVEVVEKRLSGQELACSECGEQMTEIGKEVVRRLKIVPAKFVVVETHIYRYACKSCDQNRTSTRVIAARDDKPVIPGSIATPEAIAYVMTQKFMMYSPLYRMEQEFGRAGVPLSRQTMANWLVKATEPWLRPVYHRLHEHLLTEPVLHADETTLQVLREPNRKAQSQSYMWLYRTGGYAEHPVVLYDYRETRKAENPKEFLDGFQGYLHTDGYAAYHKLPAGITVVGCWAHCRRKFDEALQAIPEKDRPPSEAMKGKQYCDALFAVEERIRVLPLREKTIERQRLSQPILDEFYSWVMRLRSAQKSLLGKAAHYTREQWPWLVNYLLDGRLEISNNLAERSIKPFVMGRKNFLFANTPKGAVTSAVIYSLIETAKENGLDPYRYLTWVLKTAPGLGDGNEAVMEGLLPWNAPVECRAATKAC